MLRGRPARLPRSVDLDQGRTQNGMIDCVKSQAPEVDAMSATIFMALFMALLLVLAVAAGTPTRTRPVPVKVARRDR